MKIRRANFLRGTINLPGDKSISHRAALFAALADGDTRIDNFATSADCASTVNCLEKLGVQVERGAANTIFLRGVGKNGFRKPLEALDCGNSGTTMRLIAGILAGQNFETILIGDESLSKRPMRRVIEPLTAMGARIESSNGCAPLVISGTESLNGRHFEPEIASAQLKSCILLAGLNASGKTSILERTVTRDHTERMLRYLGAEIEETTTEAGKIIGVSGDAALTARDLSVPADVSSAAFFLVAAACLDDSELILKAVGLNRSRTGVIDVLRAFGARVEISGETEVAGEPVGDLTVRGGSYGGRKKTAELAANMLCGKIIANIIDEIPILAVFATQLEHGLEIRDASELRVKESDRIAATIENLRRMGATVDEFPDGMKIYPAALKGATVESFGDHRIAMAFAVAGLLAETGETTIDGADCAAVSFPEFFETLASVSG